ncbi:metallophosphoesterase [Bacillus nitratireducens]|uniref:metallophosphoesterase n=1 Tax=Bacillus nitratireducens TaxID=2026193 RepID=UPI002E1F834A|nr:metallophosphoesterase [Bacillus nitratireducens]
MRIVHISDFHLDSSSIEDLRNYIIKPLKADLLEFHNNREIDLILFSGDMVDKGGASFNRDTMLAFYTFQEEVIEPLMKNIGLPLERFFMVPGNHDVNRNLDSEVLELGLSTFLHSSDKVNTFIDSEDTSGISRVLPFKEYEKEFYQDFSGELKLSNYQSAFKLQIKDIAVGITCFNSSWRSYDSDTDFQKIIIGERQITRARDVIQDCQIKIGMVHHPLDELALFESKQIQQMIMKDYDILLCGHVHEGSSWAKTNSIGTMLISVSPANWTTNVRTKNSDFANGYSIIDINKEEGKIVTYHRRYSHNKEKFVKNTDMGDENGQTDFFLPTKTDIVNKDNSFEIINNIRDIHINHIDKHLISYDTDTEAPKKITEIFVMPRIIYKETAQFNEETLQENEELLNLESICRSKGNILLIGTKEQGKTILLDRVLIEMTNNFESYNKIPVYIDFEEAIGSGLETLISKYINVNIRHLKLDVLKNNDVVLLIDNIKFDRRYKAILTNLTKLIKDNPRVKIIATCSGNIDGELPIEALDTEIFNHFKTAYIKDFKTREIRELMQNWFSLNERFILDKKEKLDSIIKTFSSLKLPRTPLAVSMFLWIIEKQEDYAPINNSIMLENFLERLFRKTSEKEMYASEFNYKNKERLLTEIAYYMFQQNKINYSVNYQELRDFIYQNLKIKKFDFDEEHLLQHFINKGVLTVDKEGIDRKVRFKFSCFFQFFLMKNIDKDQEFKEHVLSEDNYLLFMNELDYYSGLKQDDAKLLELVVNRMYSEYEGIIDKIEKLQYNYDNVFETLSTIVDRLSAEDIKQITSNDKPTEEEIEELHDNTLSKSSKETGINKKDEEISNFDKLARVWIIAAKILKNTEDTMVEGLKTDSFNKIVKCSMAFASIYKFILIKYQEKHEEDQEEEKKEEMEILKNLMPLIHQSVLLQTMGTGKLKVVIEERLEEIIGDEDVSDFEKFLCVFMYSDLKGNGANKYIANLIKVTKRHYMKDMIFMKLLQYFYDRSTTKVDEGVYKNFIGDIITKDDTDMNGKRDFHRKGRIISKIVDSKNKKMLQSKDGDLEGVN